MLRRNLGQAALLGSLMLSPGCDRIATWYAGPEPDSPVEPIKPELGEVHRPPIQVIVAVDATKSDIKEQLPDVLSATRDFVTKGEILEDGDSLLLCEIKGKNGGAVCHETYTLPQDEERLMRELDAIEADGLHTWIRPALDTIRKSSDPQQPRVAAVWSDFIEEAKEPKAVRMPYPTKLMIPDAQYRDDAEAMCENIRGRCDVVAANTGEQFGLALEGFTEELKKDAYEEAEDEAQRQLDEEMAEYEEAMAEYESLKDAHEAEVAKYKQKWRTVRNRIATAIGGVVAASIALFSLSVVYYNRPRVTGFLVDVRNKKRIPETYYLDTRQKTTLNISKVDPVLPEIVLKANKAGVSVPGQKNLKNGEEIEDGIYWFDRDSEPSAKELKAFRDKHHSTDEKEPLT